MKKRQSVKNTNVSNTTPLTKNKYHLTCTKCKREGVFYAYEPPFYSFINSYLCTSCYKKKMNKIYQKYVLCKECDREYRIPAITPSPYTCPSCKDRIENGEEVYERDKICDV